MEFIIDAFKVVLFFTDVDLNGTVIYKDNVAVVEREGCDRLLASIGKTNKWFLMADSPLRGISKEDNDFYESLFIKALQQAPISSNNKLKKICWSGINSSDLAAIKKQWNQIKEQ